MPERNSAPHTFQKDGIYYFNRRVPAVLRKHYTSPGISYSLRTRSKSVAASRAVRAAGQLDEYWFHLRSQNAELPGKHLLKMQDQHRSGRTPPRHDVKAANLSLSEAVGVHLRLKGAGKGKTFSPEAPQKMPILSRNAWIELSSSSTSCTAFAVVISS